MGADWRRRNARPRSETAAASIAVGSRPRDVQRDDVRRAIEAARGVQLPEDRGSAARPAAGIFSGRAGQRSRDAIGMVEAAAPTKRTRIS